MSSYLAESAPTQHVVGSKARYGYREIGTDSGSPIVLLPRYRGTIDDWDPALIEDLATKRRVIVFDNVGIGSTDGVAPPTIAEMAEGVVDFLAAKDLAKVDVLGWSSGGFVAQLLALDHPESVNKIVVAGSGPGEPAIRPEEDPKSVEIRTKVDLDVDDILYIFFSHTDSGRQAGLEVLSRFFHHESGVVETVREESWQNHADAIAKWNSGDGSAWERLSQISVPVLVANGADDVMEHAVQSFEMVRRLRYGKAIFYSDAGHGFLFERHEDFSREVLNFFAG
jgi:pimeloyl-ACP methyl ester carboxylesterase